MSVTDSIFNSLCFENLSLVCVCCSLLTWGNECKERKTLWGKALTCFEFEAYLWLVCYMQISFLITFCCRRFGLPLWWKNGWTSSLRWMILAKMKWTLKLRVKMMVCFGVSLYSFSHLDWFFSFSFHIFFFFFVSFNFHPACSLKDSRMGVREDNPIRTQGNQSIFPSQTSGNNSFLFSNQFFSAEKLPKK